MRNNDNDKEISFNGENKNFGRRECTPALHYRQSGDYSLSWLNEN